MDNNVIFIIKCFLGTMYVVRFICVNLLPELFHGFPVETCVIYLEIKI